MNAERWARVRSLFHTLISLPAPQRFLKLTSFSSADADVREELQNLLAESDSARGFLSSTNPPVPASLVSALHYGEIVGDRYEVMELLGIGGMGEVYKVYDRELKEIVALKTLRNDTSVQPELVSRLRKELQLARRIVHPNVCRMFEMGHAARASGELVYLTMELLVGPTLSQALRLRPMTVIEAEPIAKQLIAGLDAAHRQSILHRDFKSSNVILAVERAVITDFGLAREQDVRETFSAFGTGAIVGTPAYMPPEQLQGKPLTKAADIHALGAVLFEMVTGSLPFRGESALAIALKRLQERAPSPRDLVPSLNARWTATIQACLEKEPANRPESANEVLALLEGRTKRPFRWPTRRFVAGSLATGAASVGVYIYLRPKTIDPEAYRSFKKAEEFARRRTAADLQNAALEYQRAVTLQSDFAPAWAGLANTYSALSEFGLMDARESNQKAIDAAQHAITLDPRSARAHGVLGYIISNDLKRWRTAEPHFQRAVRYDPKDPMVRLWFASFLGKSGDSNGALIQIRQGLNDDPSNFVLNQQLASELYRARRYDECYRQAVELERLQPYEGGTHFMMARALERQRRFADALARCDDAVKYGLNTRLVDTMRAVIEWSNGRPDVARRLAQAADEYWREKPMATIQVASAYGHIGESTRAIEVLLIGCDRDDASVLGAPRHPLLEPLRFHPRYAEFLSRIGVPIGDKALG